MIEKLVQLLAGIVLLTSGKRLFWLFIGCIGFVFGFNYASAIIGSQESWAVLGFALLAGIVGAMMAIFLQGIAIAVGGFLAGGLITLHILNILGFSSNEYFWIAQVLGGIAGLILMLLVFDWALILLSSIIGAGVIVEAFFFSPPARTLCFLVLTVAGVAFQASFFKKKSY